MPLVSGNILSFFSISFAICFYLVINESSVWWQQAAGCPLVTALSSLTACQTSLRFLCTSMQMQPSVRTRHMHPVTYSHSTSTFLSLRRIEFKEQQQTQEGALSTPALVPIHTIGDVTLIMLFSPQKVFLHNLNHT